MYKEKSAQKSAVLTSRNPALERGKGEARKIQGEKPTVLKCVVSKTVFHPSQSRDAFCLYVLGDFDILSFLLI